MERKFLYVEDEAVRIVSMRLILCLLHNATSKNVQMNSCLHDRANNTSKFWCCLS